jgi:replicative DNA helicase
MQIADQLNVFDAYVNDDRGTIPTGYGGLDGLLRRGGLAPQTLALLGGRLSTRKTTTVMNIAANMLDGGAMVGLVGLDGSLSNNYISRLYSTWSGFTVDHIEETWNTQEAEEHKQRFMDWAKNFIFYNGPRRPDMPDLTNWLLETEVSTGQRISVVLIDYVGLMRRGKYDGNDQVRIPRLIEDIKIWTDQEDLITIALHQVARMDEGSGVRYHGHHPMTVAGMKFGGEDVADIVLATYRPTLNPVGHMDFEMAQEREGSRFTHEDWEKVVALCERTKDLTYLQLLKNRPGTKIDERGICLRSLGETMKMREVSAFDALDQDQVMAYG